MSVANRPSPAQVDLARAIDTAARALARATITDYSDLDLWEHCPPYVRENLKRHAEIALEAALPIVMQTLTDAVAADLMERVQEMLTAPRPINDPAAWLP